MKKLLTILLVQTITFATAEESLFGRPSFPSSDKTKNFISEIEDADFSSDQYVFKIGGSTSCNVHIYKKDPTDLKDGLKKVGKLVPENPAGNPNTEVAYFNFGRLVGAEKVFIPATPYIMNQKQAVSKFLETVSNPKKSRTHRKNCEYIGNRVRSEGKVEGAFKKKISGDKIDTEDYYISSGLRTSKIVSQYLSQGKAKPTSRLMSLDSRYVSSSYKNEGRILAHSLFHVLIADVLFSQYDRWSGDNFTVLTKTDKKTGIKTVNFLGKDNGGTYLIPGYTRRNLKALSGNWFSRYYKPTMDILLELNQFLDGDLKKFQGFKSKSEFAYALGLRFERTNGRDAPRTPILKQLATFHKNLTKLIDKYESDIEMAKRRNNLNDAFLPLID